MYIPPCHLYFIFAYMLFFMLTNLRTDRIDIAHTPCDGSMSLMCYSLYVKLRHHLLVALTSHELFSP